MEEEGGGATAFPVLFYDGERELDIGDVEISPMLEYKPFQQMLSQKIGISPNQISTYLVNRGRNHKSAFAEDRRRFPITGKVNFASICRQRGCSFLVVLKRSRKSRNRRERMLSDAEISDYSPENEFSPNPAIPVPANLILLRRSPAAPFYDHISQSELDDLNGRLQLRDLNGRLQSLWIQNEKYQKAIAKENVNSPNFYSKTGFDSNAYLDSFPAIEDLYRVDSTIPATKTEAGKAFCEECWNNAKNNSDTTSFHHCVNDKVITRITTRLPPISRPAKPLA
ncbi:uncharacterized protein LOC127263392 [Andrographis paniculata]|uniref:uncharacterized protein LOC127263392 n=1 Tax=Andrographis paniculata TaxID=175694 RepID=UPI0021E7C924|nr:uncharacterized protein LOC127263392 [Andrographis paniculata]XP_051148345.1 uncharacterized protein LOC127263392 [Andrographis paniculata]